ncbi:GNAT family N-acetyltransferase [Zobellella denitrificans]|uniref:GNAT family N-acetyltransferase n=1 Tax=Zobellella denitrificans TaxID=347534 RepID=UPI0015956A70|nr:GNAT family N-acetyltransferase [Zobellella denitrificans]
MIIRPFDPATDLPGLRTCVHELQEAERALDPRLPAGDLVLEPYLAELFRRCARCAGRILVAERAGVVAGFVAVLTRVVSEEPDDGGLEYGLISDLHVRAPWRRRGLGRQLLAAAEAQARQEGVRWLRIGVLAANAPALALYRAAGFKAHLVELEKDL